MKTTLWKSEDAKQRMREWHETFRARIGHALDSRVVTTSFGETHVLVGGPVDAPPVVLLHGALATSAHVMRELEPLLDRHRVYAVDVVGQSVMSADVRLPVDDDTCGQWLAETFDALEIARAAVIGISWSGFVAQRFAKVAPERVTTLVLLVPAGLVASPRWRGFVQMGWPLTRFLFSPNASNRDRLLTALLSTPDDDLWGPYLADAFTSANLSGMRVPRLSRDGEFSSLACPVHVIAAEQDVSFPGDALIARARSLFPTLAHAEVLEGMKHSPPTTPEFREAFSAKIASLLPS